MRRGRRGSAGASESPISASSAISADSASEASAVEFGHVLARGVGLVHAGLHVLGLGALPVLAAFLLAALLLALLAFLLVGFGRAVLAHVEAVEQVVHDVAETRLVVDQPLQPVEIAPGAVLDQRPPEIDELLAPPAAAPGR